MRISLSRELLTLVGALTSLLIPQSLLMASLLQVVARLCSHARNSAVELRLQVVVKLSRQNSSVVGLVNILLLEVGNFLLLIVVFKVPTKLSIF